MSVKRACDNFELAFDEAEAKLDKITENVDATIAMANSTSTAGANTTSTSYLLKSLKEIKSQHNALTKEIEALKATQDAFVANMLQDLMKLQDAETLLEKKTGFEPK